jgi:predicted HicB family RNase H-like nuclease
MRPKLSTEQVTRILTGSRSGRLSVRLPDDLKTRVEAAAAAAGLSITDYVLLVLEQHLKGR